jgi:hypothetical protein
VCDRPNRQHNFTEYGSPQNKRMKLTGAAILVSRGMKLLQAAPAAYPYRSASEMVGQEESQELRLRGRRATERREHGRCCGRRSYVIGSRGDCRSCGFSAVGGVGCQPPNKSLQRTADRFVIWLLRRWFAPPLSETVRQCKTPAMPENYERQSVFAAVD